MAGIKPLLLLISVKVVLSVITTNEMVSLVIGVLVAVAGSFQLRVLVPQWQDDQIWECAACQ